jgi:hypothetical protein
MRIILLFTILLVLFGCGENLPKGILSSKTMTSVLVDIHLAEALYSQPGSAGIYGENLKDDLYLSVLKKHGIKHVVFETSLLYYGKNPDKFKPIYDDVVDRINVMETMLKINDSIASIKKPNKHSLDSLDAVNTIDSLDSVNSVDSIDTVNTQDTVRTIDTIKTVKPVKE